MSNLSCFRDALQIVDHVFAEVLIFYEFSLTSLQALGKNSGILLHIIRLISMVGMIVT